MTMVLFFSFIFSICLFGVKCGSQFPPVKGKNTQKETRRDEIWERQSYDFKKDNYDQERFSSHESNPRYGKEKSESLDKKI